MKAKRVASGEKRETRKEGKGKLMYTLKVCMGHI